MQGCQYKDGKGGNLLRLSLFDGLLMLCMNWPVVGTIALCTNDVTKF